MVISKSVKVFKENDTGAERRGGGQHWPEVWVGFSEEVSLKWRAEQDITKARRC